MDASGVASAGSGVERHVLKPEEELRLEVSFQANSKSQIKRTLQKGACELQGVQLVLQKLYVLFGAGLKLALFTWHGCVVDVDPCGD
jgi:hypothetical protein